MPNYIIRQSAAKQGILNGSIDVEIGFDNSGVWRKHGTVTYGIIAEDLTTDEDSISATPGIPQPGTDQINGMFCLRHKIKEVGPAKHPTTKIPSRRFDLTAIFDSNVSTPDLNINPVLRPVVVERDSVLTYGPLNFDAVTGNPVVTILNEPLQVQRPIVMPLLTLSRYEAYPFPEQNIIDFTNITNLAPFRGAPSGTAIITKVRTREVDVNGSKYEHVFYTVQVRIDPDNPARTDTWKALADHKGTWYKRGDGVITNRDRDGAINKKFFNLTVADGFVIPEGDPVEKIEFNRLKKAAFPVGLG